MGIVTLVSGGIDSTLMSVLFKDAGETPCPLFIEYGQLAARKEWETCLRVHRRLKLKRPLKMDLRGFGHLISSGLTDRRKDINLDAFLPGRNAMFLLAAASYAFSVGYRTVAIGLLSERTHIFPDQTKEFLNEMENAIVQSLGEKINLVAPLMGFTKTEILAMADKKEISGTYSCHSGLAKPCGKCVSCLEIMNS